MAEQTGADPRGRRSYPKGTRRRQQILESAIALFAQRGVDRASLRTMADAIGVSHTALWLIAAMFLAAFAAAGALRPRPPATVTMVRSA